MLKDRLIWFKGNLVSADQAMVPILSPTAQFGLNVFEGLRGYWNHENEVLHLFRLDDHLARLQESCKLIGIECPYDNAAITQAIFDTIKANGYQQDVAVRVTVFVDEEGTWSSSTPVDMFVAPIAKSRSDVDNLSGYHACISTWERISDRCFPPRIKAGANYINGRYANLEAKRNGYDFPLMLGHNGKLSEGAGACVFMLRQGQLVTPETTDSILESITRETLMVLAEQEGIKVVERQIDRTELYLADELFLCGSAAEVMSIISVDRITVSTGEVGDFSHKLLSRYIAIAANVDKSFPEWRTAVPSG